MHIKSEELRFVRYCSVIHCQENQALTFNILRIMTCIFSDILTSIKSLVPFHNTDILQLHFLLFYPRNKRSRLYVYLWQP